MSTPEERAQLLASLRALPAALEDLLRRFSPEKLCVAPEPEAWSACQVIHHLADAHMNAFIRMKLILTEENPILKPFNQVAFAALPDANQLPIETSLKILHGLHERWYCMLVGLPEEAWQRVGIHLERGRISLDDLLSMYAAHGEEHLTSLRQQL